MNDMRPYRWLLLALLPLLGNGPPDAFTSAISALRTGFLLESKGPSRALRRAAVRLSASGAQGLNPSDDLVLRWLGPAAQTPTKAFRNRALGPAYRRITLNGGLTAHFEQVFLAGQRARVAIVPVNNAAFGLIVADDTGQAICAPKPVKGPCDWVPLYTSRFSIDLKNHSASTASYVLVMQ
jgi:hypothetical protein